MTKVIDLIHSTQSSAQSLMLLPTDAEKAFVWVDWQFLWSMIICPGSQMILWILELNSHPPATVKINKTWDNYFYLSNGTWQGRSLSPLIFILTRTISMQGHIRPICYRPPPLAYGIQDGSVRWQFTVLPYGVWDLPTLNANLLVWGTNFAINFSKSKALNRTLTQGRVTHLQQSYQFHWTFSTMRYLGTNNNSNPSTLLQRPLSTIHSDFQKWQGLTFTCFSHCNAFKMMILHQIILYI